MLEVGADSDRGRKGLCWVCVEAGAEGEGGEREEGGGEVLGVSWGVTGVGDWKGYERSLFVEGLGYEGMVCFVLLGAAGRAQCTRLFQLTDVAACTGLVGKRAHVDDHWVRRVYCKYVSKSVDVSQRRDGYGTS